MAIRRISATDTTSTTSAPANRSPESTPVRTDGRAGLAVGALPVLVAASLWGTTGTVRVLAPSSATAVSIGAARIVLGGLLLLAVAALTRGRAVGEHGPDGVHIGRRGQGLRRLLAAEDTARRRAARWALLGTGVACVAIYQTAFFAAVGRTGVATGTVVTIGSAPAFAGLLARVTGSARPSRRWFLATMGAVAGCTALIVGGQGAGVEPVGVTLALLAGLGYAVYASVAAHLIRAGHQDRAVVAVLFGGAGLILMPALLTGPVLWLATPAGALVTVYLGAITTTLGYLLYARGLRTTPVATATTLGLAEPAVAALLGLVVLHEHLGTVALAGLGLLAASLLLLMAPSGGDRRARR